MKMISLSLVALAALSAGAYAAPESARSISLTQDPLVMRVNKNEFRIAFGINGERCGANGCSGMIRYRVEVENRGREDPLGNPNASITPCRQAPAAPLRLTGSTLIRPKASIRPMS